MKSVRDRVQLTIDNFVDKVQNGKMTKADHMAQAATAHAIFAGYQVIALLDVADALTELGKSNLDGPTLNNHLHEIVKRLT